MQPIKKNAGNVPYLPTDAPAVTAGGEAPAVVAPASRGVEAMANTPPGVPPAADPVDRGATYMGWGPRSWEQLTKGAEAVLARAPGDDRIKAGVSTLYGALMRAEYERGKGNQYMKADIWDKVNVANEAGKAFGLHTGVLPNTVKVPIPGRDRGWDLVLHKDETVDDALGAMVRTLEAKEGLKLNLDDARAAALASIDPADVAFLRQQAQANPKLMEGIDLASPEADTILRAKVLEGRLTGNRAMGFQTHFHGRDILGLGMRNLSAVAAQNSPHLDALIDAATGIPGHAAFLRGGGAAAAPAPEVAAAGGGAAPPPPPAAPAPAAAAGGPGWMGQARNWATEVNPKAYTTLLGQLPNWQHLAGGLGAGAGAAALLAALGQPQDDTDAYLAMLAAKNAAPAPAPY